MKFVPCSDVTYLRDNCHDDSRFPNPHDATNEVLESVPYLAELWWDADGVYVRPSDGWCVVVTFDEIRQFFGDPDDYEEWDNVYDYLRDCIDNGFHPVTVKGDE